METNFSIFCPQCGTEMQFEKEPPREKILFCPNCDCEFFNTINNTSGGEEIDSFFSFKNLIIGLVSVSIFIWGYDLYQKKRHEEDENKRKVWKNLNLEIESDENGNYYLQPQQGMNNNNQGLNFIQILNKSYSINYDLNAITIYCQVANRSNKLLSYVSIKGVCYSKNGKIVGTGIGAVSNIPSGESKTCEIMVFDVTNRGKSFDCEIYDYSFY